MVRITEHMSFLTLLLDYFLFITTTVRKNRLWLNREIHFLRRKFQNSDTNSNLNHKSKIDIWHNWALGDCWRWHFCSQFLFEILKTLTFLCWLRILDLDMRTLDNFFLYFVQVFLSFWIKYICVLIFSVCSVYFMFSFINSRLLFLVLFLNSFRMSW